MACAFRASPRAGVPNCVGERDQRADAPSLGPELDACGCATTLTLGKGDQRCRWTETERRDRSPGRKQGNPQLKWAFSEAVGLLMQQSPTVKSAFAKLEKRHGKGKALSILGARLGRAVYLILKRGDIFNEHQFLKLD